MKNISVPGVLAKQWREMVSPEFAIGFLKIAVILGCIWLLWDIVRKWPYPNALTRPLLPPRLAYPEPQIRQWVESGDFDPSFLRFFNRDPERRPPPGIDYLAPADGKLREVALHNGTTIFIVALSFWDVHVVRSPATGVVRDVHFAGAGLFRSAQKAKTWLGAEAKTAPVQAVITIDTDLGPVVVRMITSWWASRLKVAVGPGMDVRRGDRIGRIVLGSTTTFDVPGKHSAVAPVGSQVVAGETVIARAQRRS
jgi:phosphatidylserine decarboxylase